MLTACVCGIIFALGSAAFERVDSKKRTMAIQGRTVINCMIDFMMDVFSS